MASGKGKKQEREKASAAASAATAAAAATSTVKSPPGIEIESCENRYLIPGKLTEKEWQVKSLSNYTPLFCSNSELWDLKHVRARARARNYLEIP